MKIGVPKEIKPQENRIGLTPDSVKTLVSEGHEVLVENNGGFEAGFDNEQYKAVGAKIVHKASDIFKAIAPVTEKYVRLINAFGKWELSPTNENETLLVYTWNGELLGDFPEFALKRAWKTQGNEIIHWIKDALK